MPRLPMHCIVMAYAALLLAACGGASSSPSTPASSPSPDFTKLSSSCFVGNPSTPVMSRDNPSTSSAGFSADWNDPSVIKVDNEYWMYASSDDNFDINVKIYRLTSGDGIHWTLNPTSPVLDADRSTAGRWDWKSVETPSVVRYKGLYHLFYTGYPVNYTQTATYKIGHATSADGIHWTRDSSNPLLAPTDPGGAVNLDFNQFIVAEPAAVVFNDKIYLYFSAVGANLGVGTTLQVIGLTTFDGSTWSTPVSVLEPDQSVYPRATWYGYSTPHAIVLNGRMHLYFDVVQASPWKQVKLHHAESPDGRGSWQQDAAAIFDTSDFAWSDDEIRSPSVLLDATTLHMWFAGTQSGVSKTIHIGHAQCQL